MVRRRIGYSRHLTCQDTYQAALSCGMCRCSPVQLVRVSHVWRECAFPRCHTSGKRRSRDHLGASYTCERRRELLLCPSKQVCETHRRSLGPTHFRHRVALRAPASVGASGHSSMQMGCKSEHRERWASGADRHSLHHLVDLRCGGRCNPGGCALVLSTPSREGVFNEGRQARTPSLRAVPPLCVLCMRAPQAPERLAGLKCAMRGAVRRRGGAREPAARCVRTASAPGVDPQPIGHASAGLKSSRTEKARFGSVYP